MEGVGRELGLPDGQRMPFRRRILVALARRQIDDPSPGGDIYIDLEGDPGRGLPSRDRALDAAATPNSACPLQFRKTLPRAVDALVVGEFSTCHRTLRLAERGEHFRLRLAEGTGRGDVSEGSRAIRSRIIHLDGSPISPYAGSTSVSQRTRRKLRKTPLAGLAKFSTPSPSRSRRSDPSESCTGPCDLFSRPLRIG